MVVSVAEGGDLVVIYSWHWRYDEDFYDDRRLGGLWVDSRSHDHLSSDNGDGMFYFETGAVDGGVCAAWCRVP